MASKELLNFFNGDELAASVWEKKYKFKDEKTPYDSFKRYCKEIAEKELERANKFTLYHEIDEALSNYGKERWYKIKQILTSNNPELRRDLMNEYFRNFINFDNIVLGGSMLATIGNHESYSSLSNCFVLGRPYDSYAGINQKTMEICGVMSRRGGGGLDLSGLRPDGATIHNQANISPGPILFAERYSNITKEVAIHGRRGALMLSMQIAHPNSIEFAESKQDLTKITGANISVILNNEFMQAVLSKDDNTYIQHFPVDVPLEYFDTSYIESDCHDLIETTYEKDGKLHTGYVRLINAKEAWDKIIHCAWNTAEPGVIFGDNWFDGGTDAIYDRYRPITTNPCFAGETPVMTDKGYFQIKDLVGKKVNVWNGQRWSEVEPQITNHNQEMLKITLSDGSEFRCTKYHNWLIDDNGNEKIIEARYLSIGNKLINFNMPDNTLISDIFIENIEESGIDENVYCFTELELHRAVFNGHLIGQCSEIPMQPYDSCRLASINLYSFVNNPFTMDAEFDFNRFYKVAYEQVCILDNTIDIEKDYIQRIIDKINSDTDEPIELRQQIVELWTKILNEGQAGRRCGAGFTALGDTLAALGLSYNNSLTTKHFLKNLFKKKMEAELDATVDLAILFGTFEGYDFNKEYYENSDDIIGSNKIFNTIQKEFPEQFNRMMKYGRRNVSWSTAAPTGSLSILTQTTSGIEPLFLPYYKRRKKCITHDERVDYIDPADGQKFTEFFVLHPKFKLWLEMQGINPTNISETQLQRLFEQSPWFGCCANDLTWIDRVNIQAIVQKYTTHSISSTINLPNNIDEGTISDIYLESWRQGLKGNTVYRDGSRGGVLVSTSDNNGSKKNDENDFSENRAPKRPKSLPAFYHTLRYRNKVYSVIIGLFDNKPYEVFIASDIDGMPENFDDFEDKIKGEIVKEDKNWYNFECDGFILKDIADAESEERLTSLMISMALRHRTPLKYVIKTLEKSRPIAGSFTHRLIKILSQYMTEENTNEKCPECGSVLKHENGCKTCPSCGWSKCN